MKRFRLDGSWDVDPLRNRIERGGERRILEPRQMDVLVRLARAPGEVVSKQSLLSDIWDDRFVVEHVVPKTISGLRLALGETARSSRVIETVGRRGYRIAVPVSEWRADVPAPGTPDPVRRAPVAGASRLAVAAALGGFLALPIAGGKHAAPPPEPRIETAIATDTGRVLIKTEIRLSPPQEAR